MSHSTPSERGDIMGLDPNSDGYLSGKYLDREYRDHVWTTEQLDELRRNTVRLEQQSWPKRNKTRLPNGKNPFPLEREILRFYGL
jgi:hypothetical protein